MSDSPISNSNKDNIVANIARVYLSNATSKAGNSYTLLNVVWILKNGKTYEQAIFITREQKAIIEMTVAKDQVL